MTNRREFIHAGTLAMGAIAGGAALLSPQARASQPPSTALPLHMVIFDDRFQDSILFAAEARNRGLTTRSVDRGDATRLWYDDLYHRWKQGPAAIAGLTTPEALFVLETLGNDAGLRLRFKAEHRILADRVEHQLYGPPLILRSALVLDSGGPKWSAHMGRIVSSVGSEHFGRSEDRRVTDLADAAPAERNMLVSWVLAPRMPRAAASFTVA